MRIIFTILAVLLSGFVLAQQGQNEKYKLAQDLEKEKKYDEAIELYLELHNRQPQNYIFFSRLNYLYKTTKQYTQSLDLLTRWYKTHPGDINILGEMGTTYYLMGDVDSAFAKWDEATTTAGSSQTKYIVISNFAMQNRAYDKAIEILDRGKKENPAAVNIIRQLANLYFFKMNFEEATKEYCGLLLIDEKQFPAVLAGFRQYVIRENTIEKAAPIISGHYENTGNVVYLKLLKDLFLFTKKYHEAVDVVIRLNEISDDPNNLFELGNILQREKQLNLAEQIYARIMDKYTDEKLQALALLNLTNVRGKLIYQSVHSIKKWKQINPAVKINLPVIDSLIENYKKLEDYFGINNRRPDILMKLADIYLKFKLEYDKADSIYTEILSMYGPAVSGLDAQYKLMQSDCRVGDLSSAVERSNWILNHPINDRQRKDKARFLKTKTLFWQNKFTDARELLDMVRRNFESDLSNDALDLSLILSMSKNDSLNLSVYASADQLLYQGKYKEAGQLFRSIADNESLLLLNMFARIELAHIYVAHSKYNEAIAILNEFTDAEKISPFSDKALYLQGKIYQFGLKNKSEAKNSFSELLERYPDSIYSEKCRKSILIINQMQ